MPTHSALSPPRPWWHGCLVIVVALVVAGSTMWLLWNRWQQDERDRRAPIIVNIPAGGCELSPGKQFLLVQAAGLGPGDFFVADTGQKVTVPLPPDLPQKGPRLWLRDEVFFVYSQWTKADVGSRFINVPQNGWLIDVANRVVTDVLTLDPPARQATLALARQRVQAQFTGGLPAPSPDGRFIYNDYVDIAAITTPSHDIRNRIRTWRSIQACIPGWRPDSRGYYVIDRTRVGLFGVGPGPIRLLLVNPPPRPWTQYAPSVGAALLLVIGGGWGWRRTIARRQGGA